MPDVHALGGNIRLYADNKVFYVYESATGNPYAFFGDLKAYVTAKLMWNAYQPVDPLIDRFMKAIYGPAAGKAREVLDLFETYERDLVNTRMGYGEDVCNTNWPDALFERAAGLWKEAESLAAGTPHAEVVHRARFGNDTTRLARYVSRLAEGEPVDESASMRDEMLAVAKELLEIDAEREKRIAANPDEKCWKWGWGWESRRKLKPKIKSFVDGRKVRSSKKRSRSDRKSKRSEKAK